MKIRSLTGLEILDSRGRPTVAAICELENGVRVQAHAPSGASTGKHEAHELRDGEAGRYGGKGVRQAVANVGLLREALSGIDAFDQASVDRALCQADGSADKSRLGANALLAVSCAVARAGAESHRLPLWRWLASGRPACLSLDADQSEGGTTHEPA